MDIDETRICSACYSLFPSAAKAMASSLSSTVGSDDRMNSEWARVGGGDTSAPMKLDHFAKRFEIICIGRRRHRHRYR